MCLTIIMAGGRRPAAHAADRRPFKTGGTIWRHLSSDRYSALSNCINSQLYKILVFPQYKSQSLVDHLEDGWNIFSSDLGHYLRIVAPQQRMGERLVPGHGRLRCARTFI